MPDSSYFSGAQAGLPSAPTGQFMPTVGQYRLTKNALNRGIQNVTESFDQGAAGPFKSLMNYVSGSGALQTGDDTGTLSLAPGGSFELKSPQGFSVTGDPVMRSLGMNVPVGGGNNRGTIGLQGSWGADPSIQANFQFGRPSPVVSSSEQVVNDALGPAQQPEVRSEPSARDFLNQKIDEYRSSGGRDKNSPSTWR